LVLILAYLILAILLFLWVLKPLVANKKPMTLLKEIDIHNYKSVLIFLILATLIIKGIFDVRLGEAVLEVDVIFLFFKIIASIIMLLILMLTLFIEKP